MVYRIIKRLIDTVAGITGVLVFSIPMAAVYAALKLEKPGPAAFVRVRLGRGGERFRMYKFASMITRTEEEDKKFIERWKKEDPELWEKYKANNFKLENDPRVTKLGRVIRKYSLDELPQFFNILKGEMSLVGPRAYFPEELEEYVREHPEAKEDVDLILTVKPGITGVWQVSGRSDTSFEERIKIDVGYASRRSLLEDVGIILATPAAVFKGKGAY
ncbi:MAG: sugar transferase [Patescibacteria group bacterium]|nr:MAG: sugar transferase [Patescibacteria group bacterium]